MAPFTVTNGGDQVEPEIDHEFVPFSKFATQAVHVGSETDQWGSADLVPHITLSTTFRQTEPGVFNKYDYSRAGNPTRNALERAIAASENAEYAVTYSSGTAAIASIIHLVKAGEEVVSMFDLYGGTNTYFREIAVNDGVLFKFVDCTVVENVAKALSPLTRMVWIESPSNPIMKIVDIPAVSKVVKDYNQDIIIVVDNTFMSPYFMRPLDLGADISHQSCTKYMNGHLDVLMGCAATKSEALSKRLKYMQNNIGAVPSPFECYLVLRSLKTLPVRMKEHMRNGLIIARFLEKHPCVESVNHPGLPSHPQFELTKRQCRGYSGVLSFYLKGDKADLWKFFKNLKVFTLAANLGGCESIASFPSIMTHDGISKEILDAAGIRDNLARLSVGLEDVEDLVEDLDQALRSILDKPPTVAA